MRPLALTLALAACLGAQSPPAAQGSASNGEALFLGAVRFRNGGPACVSCHAVAGLPFPNGGSMGPDLTRVYTKLGPTGLNSALETLFFPAMTPLFQYRPLTPQERADLAAYFQSTAQRQPPAFLTASFALIALAGFLILLAGTWIAGRRRVLSVRRALLERVARGARA